MIFDVDGFHDRGGRQLPRRNLAVALERRWRELLALFAEGLPGAAAADQPSSAP